MDDKLVEGGEVDGITVEGEFVEGEVVDGGFVNEAQKLDSVPKEYSERRAFPPQRVWLNKLIALTRSLQSNPWTKLVTLFPTPWSAGFVWL